MSRLYKKKKNKVQEKSSAKSSFSGGRSDVSTHRQRRIFIIILFVYSCFLYINTLNHGYAFDDSVAITDNQFTKQGIKGIPQLLTQDFFAGIYNKALELGGGRYRPLSLVMFAIEYEFFGANPFVGHLINILLYAFTGLVLLRMLEEFFPGRFLLSALITLLFIAHPVHTEVVANIKSRDEILSFLGLCLALLYLFRYQKIRKSKYIIYSVVFYFLSLLSKENGITFLAIIPLTLYCFSDRDVRKSLIATVPFLITGFVYVALRTSLVGMIGDRENNDVMENPFVGISTGDRLATITHILGKYLGLLFFPHPLSCDYSYNQIPIIGWSNIKAIIPFVVYTALFVYALVNIKRKDIISYGILFYLITLSLVSNIVFNIGAPMGERFLFLPSLGFCIAISALLLKLYKSVPQNTFKFYPALFIPVGIVLIGFSYKTIQRNKDWKDNVTLFGADAKTVPNSAKIRYYYGNTLLNKALAQTKNPERVKWLQIALTETRAATAINPKFHHAWYAMGMTYQELGQADSAIMAYHKVLELQPTHILTQSALGAAYGKMKGDVNNAIKYLEIAVKYNPKDGSSWENLGIAYAMKKDFPASLKAFEQAMKLKPESAQSYLNLALTYQSMGDQQKADSYFEKAFQLDPSLRTRK